MSIQRVLGNYFTPSKTPATWAQEAFKGILLGAVAYGSLRMIVRAGGSDTLIGGCVFLPIAEEIVYRGALPKIIDISLNIIQGRPKTTAQSEARKTARAVISAAYFGYHHDDLPLLKFWLLGRALGYLKEETGGYLLPIALHIINNTAAELEQWQIDHDGRILPIILPINILALYLLRKNINPWTGLKETYHYFTSKEPKVIAPKNLSHNR